MKINTTDLAPGAINYKISQIGHQYKLVSSLPGSKAEKFPSAMELVKHLNKNKIKPQNQDIIPTFYKTMLNNEK